MAKLAFFAIVLQLAISTVAYLALKTFIDGHLRRVHPATWEQLGRPSMVRARQYDKNPLELIQPMLLTFRFYLISDEHKALFDPRLARLILLIRIIAAYLCCLWLLLLGFGAVLPRN
jgi:hypothetical protein